MAVQIRLVSFNCRGLNSSLKELQEICDVAKIICLQEHWLSKQQLVTLSTIHENFKSTGASPLDAEQTLLTGRPYGGVAILWHNSLDAMITIINLNDDWMCGISVNTGTKKFIILCVYLPYECRDNLDKYIFCLSRLVSVIDACDSSSVYIIGDFNNDIRKGTLYTNHLGT